MTGTRHDLVIDLHTHSNASDGTEAPAEVVRQAALAGIDVLGLTDHDVTTGWAEADAAGREHGVLVVPGIEVSCSWYGISVHLLAYLPDPQDSMLMEELAQTRTSRVTRMQRMVEHLAADGYPISYAELRSGLPEDVAIGRPHLADLLIAKGIFSTREQAFEEVLSPAGPYYVGHGAIDPVRAVELVVGAGGVAVMAHPFAGSRGRVVQDEVIEEMAEAGMRGLEIEHRNHDPAQREHGRALAQRLGLVQTGASDYHGAGKPNVLAENTTQPAVLEALLAAASGYRLLGATD